MPIDPKTNQLVILSIWCLKHEDHEVFGIRAHDGATLQRIDERIPLFESLALAQLFIVNVYPDAVQLARTPDDDPRLVETWV